MSTIITTSLNRVVELREIQERLGQIDLRHALATVTKIASRQLWFPESPQVAAYVNLINLSQLAKAVVLYCPETGGRPMNLSADEDGDLRWLLTAINSMQWYPRQDVENDQDETIISFLMRQAYVRNFVGDHPVAVIGRAYAMFHELLPRVNNQRVDIDAAMQVVAGVDCRDLWIFSYAVHFFYFIECVKPEGPWKFSADFIQDSPRREELRESLGRVLARIAKTPSEMRRLYGQRKYHDPNLPTEYWLSEFNLLRDFPVVDLGNSQFCCPYPIFASMRGGVGYFFDLVNYYADLERQNNPRNPNPFDNVMNRVLGDVFQEYVGVQLGSLTAAAGYLSPEFEYAVGNNQLRTPDWLLRRLPELPVLFECKARRPALPLQSRCRAQDREPEMESVLSRALGQLTVFLRNAVAGNVPGYTPQGDWRVVYALVLYDSFPFHAMPDLRERIDTIAERLEPEWAQFRSHVLFVPLSIQELELAVQLEMERGLLIEHQLQEYAIYRRRARRMEGPMARPIFSRHFYDYALATWGQPQIAAGEVCTAYWEQFCSKMHREFYAEDLDAYEAQNRRLWIEEAAYFRWHNTGREHGHHLEHWADSEREYEELTQSRGLPPDMATRLVPHFAITQAVEQL